MTILGTLSSKKTLKGSKFNIWRHTWHLFTAPWLGTTGVKCLPCKAKFTENLTKNYFFEEKNLFFQKMNTFIILHGNCFYLLPSKTVSPYLSLFFSLTSPQPPHSFFLFFFCICLPPSLFIILSCPPLFLFIVPIPLCYCLAKGILLGEGRLSGKMCIWSCRATLEIWFCLFEDLNLHY